MGYHKTSSQINLDSSLKDNGGPIQTLALLNGSVAIATGNATIRNAAPINGLDQRGVSCSSTAPNIGAYHAGAAGPTPDTTAPAAPSIIAITDNVSPITGSVAPRGSSNDTSRPNWRRRSR